MTGVYAILEDYPGFFGFVKVDVNRLLIAGFPEFFQQPGFTRLPGPLEEQGLSVGIAFPAYKPLYSHSLHDKSSLAKKLHFFKGKICQ
jgi:hypothetical protein